MDEDAASEYYYLIKIFGVRKLESPDGGHLLPCDMMMVSVIWVGAAHQLRIDMCALVYVAHNLTMERSTKAVEPAHLFIEPLRTMNRLKSRTRHVVTVDHDSFNWLHCECDAIAVKLSPSTKYQTKTHQEMR